MNQISYLNSKLRILHGTATAALAAEVACPPCAGVIQQSRNVIEVIGKGIAGYQDILLNSEKVSTTLSRISVAPFIHRKILSITRENSLQSTANQFPPPLSWKEGPKDSLIRAYSLQTRKESFGFCAPQNQQGVLLNGEKYQIAFQMPGGHRWDKPPLKSLLRLLSF